MHNTGTAEKTEQCSQYSDVVGRMTKMFYSPKHPDQPHCPPGLQPQLRKHGINPLFRYMFSMTSKGSNSLFTQFPLAFSCYPEGQKTHSFHRKMCWDIHKSSLLDHILVPSIYFHTFFKICFNLTPSWISHHWLSILINNSLTMHFVKISCNTNTTLKAIINCNIAAGIINSKWAEETQTLNKILHQSFRFSPF